jgi:hypothetical protein
MCLYDYHISWVSFIILDLDKVTDLSFNHNLTENGTALIHFERPQGSYDEVLINCVAEDQICLKQNYSLTNTVKNCSTCTSVSISPVFHGMKYICHALTMKKSFENVTSDEFYFNTSECRDQCKSA